MNRALRRASYVGRMLAFVLRRRGTAAGAIALNRGIVFAEGMRLRIGRGVWLGAYGVFQGDGAVSIGDRTYVGHHFFLGAIGRIEIGRDCMLANFVSIVDNNHGMQPGDVPFGRQPLSVAPIVVEDNCWIAEKATILAGVRIGRGSIVAAGAVVRADVEPGTLVAGVPARVIRRV